MRDRGVLYADGPQRHPRYKELSAKFVGTHRNPDSRRPRPVNCRTQVGPTQPGKGPRPAVPEIPYCEMCCACAQSREEKIESAETT